MIVYHLYTIMYLPPLPTYTDNTTYRMAVRQIITMPVRATPRDPDLDDETADELDYDEQYMSAFLDTVYAETRDHPVFRNLYEFAAARMFSTDPEIGLAVLMSYDFLYRFYPCLVLYQTDASAFTETSREYVDIVRPTA